MMRILLSLAALLSIGLTSCGQADQTATPDRPLVQPKKCPDVNNRDRNDPCSPLYFKKKGSRLPDRDSL